MTERLDLFEETVSLGPGVRALPIVHGSAEYSVLLRQIFLTQPPACLALEIPEDMGRQLSDVLPHADQIPIISFDDAAGVPVHFILEPLEPIVEAARSASELGIPFHAIDAPCISVNPGDADLFSPQSYGFHPDWFPDTFVLRVMSVRTIYELYKKNHVPIRYDATPRENMRGDFVRELHMAQRIRTLAPLFDATTPGRLEGCLLVVCGIKHLPALEHLIKLPDEEFERYHTILSEVQQYRGHSVTSEDEEPLESLMREKGPVPEFELNTLSRESPEVLSQPGYYNATWNLVRKNERTIRAFNRIVLQRAVYRESVSRYEKESGEIFSPRIEKNFTRFARTWSWLENRLLPDAYRLVMSARAFGGDNFARIFYDILNFIPPLKNPKFPEKKLTLDDLYRDSKMIRFRVRLKKKKRVPPPPIRKKFQREKYPGEWRDSFRGGGICSYPPEDIVIEDFGTYLQKKATSVLKGAESKVTPFTSSLMDGIDYRETIRNLHVGKVFVRDIQDRGIEAGSVVIIFSDDEIEHDWKVVWWGEHNQESDMALYATAPGMEVIGPGICRCRYGGLMMTYPPRRLHDIWEDSNYAEFEKASDRLLAAAIDYNEKNAVVHLAHRPPSPKLVAIANRLGQKIIHIPISTMNSVLLGRVRRFHVLDGHDRRGEANDFIW
ncbi:MAG: hypothetical protein K8S54_17490 [Spirochaetia bacterium]|nr:hypothetical protein [Spirochaetia bacterium]